jgi:hypothetical protein
MPIPGPLGAVIAFSVLGPIAPIPAHANYIAIPLDGVTPDFTYRGLRLTDHQFDRTLTTARNACASAALRCHPQYAIDAADAYAKLRSDSLAGRALSR